jgi:hypothetical protein
MIEPRVLRPMGYADLVNEAFDLYKRNFVLFAGVPGVVYLPFSALMSCLSNDDTLNSIVALGLIGLVLAIHGAMVRAVTDRSLGVAASIRGVWGVLLRRLFPYFVTSTMAWVGLLVGFSLCWFPGFILSVRTFFLWPVMMVEERYYLAAFQRSRELGAGQWGRIVVTALLIGLLTVLPIALLISMSGEPEPPPPAGSPALHLPDWGELTGNLIFGAILALGTPLPTALGVLLYLDLRVRKEGFDVEWLSHQIEGPPSGDG